MNATRMNATRMFNVLKSGLGLVLRSEKTLPVITIVGSSVGTLGYIYTDNQKQIKRRKSRKSYELLGVKMVD